MCDLSAKCMIVHLLNKYLSYLFKKLKQTPVNES